MVYITSAGRGLAIMSGIITTIAVILTVLRFWTVFRITKRSLRLDDYFILVALACFIANEGLVFWEVRNGAGERSLNLEFPMLQIHIKAMVGFSFTWTIGTGFCKLAILSLYLELFRTKQVFKVFVWALMAATVAWMLAFVIVFNTHCDRVSDIWDPIRMTTHCKPILTEELASVISNLVLDIIVVLAPVPVIWGLQMPLRRKVTITAMFSMGLGVISLMLWRLITIRIKTRDNSADLAYDVILLLYQSSLEIWLGIVAAHLPTLAPWMEKVNRTAPMRYITSKMSIFNSSGSSKKNSDKSVTLVTIGGSGGKDKRNFQRVDDDDEALFSHA